MSFELSRRHNSIHPENGDSAQDNTSAANLVLSSDPETASTNEESTPSESSDRARRKKKFRCPKPWTWNWHWPWQKQYDYSQRMVGITGGHGGADARSRLCAGRRTDPNKVQFQGFCSNETHTSKYTIITFVPRNLFEQFRRAANFYFLATLVLTLILPDSPISPSSWALSLLFVVLVTMAKQGYEDYLRHKSDKEANERMVTVVRDGHSQSIQAQHIEVGDIIYLRDNEDVPADLVLLSSSHEQGHAFVMTANLDGETSLKTMISSSVTKGKRSVDAITALRGFVECENPNPKLDSFIGVMTALEGEEKVCSLGTDNLLLSGTTLRNTNSIFGLCVYAGRETKISLNSKITLIKFSSVERSLNIFLLFFLIVLLTEMTVSTICSMVLGVEYLADEERDVEVDAKGEERVEPRENVDHHWYLGDVFKKNFESGFSIFLVWLVLYNYIIPISMYVSIEVQKFCASMLFAWDLDLYDQARNQPALCNTSDINEELGLVTHLFTDKTGTLTQNVMVFRKYSRTADVFDRSNFEHEEWNPFLRVMTLCHSVKVAEDGHFAASSPDEKALLDACRDAGFDFMGEATSQPGLLQIQAKNDVLTFELLAELEFDSYRKCMSVVVRDESGNLHLLSKGAEVSMLPACVRGPIETTRSIVDKFADEGLRILVFAHKALTQQEWEAFSLALEAARQSMENRVERVREVYMQLEQDLEVLGATGIEDKLQENVRETINSLQTAGIIPWMLTGDKKETALNLAHAAGLLQAGSKVTDLCGLDRRHVTERVQKLYNNLSDPLANPGLAQQFQLNNNYFTPIGNSKNPSIVVDGKTIHSIMASEDVKKKFCALTSASPTVVACRLSPIQKSELVHMVKEAHVKNVTAAIGDGGNDISMIQEAHVGLGIIGLEGTAASKAADFAFTKFCMLQKVLFVHGHWYYRRLSILVQYSFYKNVATFTCQLFFAMFSNWSGQTLYDSLFLFMFNTLYACIPIVIFGLSEQDYSKETLLADPALYRIHRHNKLMRKRELFKWFFLGVWHSAAVFFCFYAIWPSYAQWGADVWGYGAVIAAANVLVVNLKMLLESRYWSWPHVIIVLLSVLSYVALTILYDQFPIYNWLIKNYDQLRAYHHVVYPMATWLVTLLAVGLAFIPDFTMHFLSSEKLSVQMRRFKSRASARVAAQPQQAIDATSTA